MILLDTSVLIAPPASWPTDAVGASAISLGELRFGVEVAQTIAERNVRLRRIARYSESLEWIPFEEPDAESYGMLAARVAQRRPSHARSKDVMIAAQAFTLGLPLMTLNTRDFELIDDLIEILAPEPPPAAG